MAQLTLAMLIMQALVFTVLCTAYLLFNTVNSGYWLLSAMTSQLALFFYLILFVAAIRLRYKYPDQHRPFKIPGGSVGIWVVACVGLLASLFTFAVGLFPPDQLKILSIWRYEAILIGGIIVVLLPGLWLFFRHKRASMRR